MGGLWSTPSTKPSDTQTEPPTPTTMPSSKTLDAQTSVSDPPIVDPTTLENQQPINSGDGGHQKGEEEEEEEGEGECGFCLFMKAGGCRDSFVAWEKCIQEADKGEDIVEKCFDVTGALKKCMLSHSDYYDPVLRAEKKAEAAAARELEKEKAEEVASGKEEESKGSDKK